jgi:hypothetical protein
MSADPAQSFWILLLLSTKSRAAVFVCLQHGHCGYEKNWASELFGDYHPETMLIRIWMRTAVRKEITSFGTFLSTLCHEFCHHLEFQRFRFPDSWHTRGFTSGLPLCTTMRGKVLPRNYSGHRYRVAAGGLTGRAPTVACDSMRSLALS